MTLALHWLMPYFLKPKKQAEFLPFHAIRAQLRDVPLGSDTIAYTFSAIALAAKLVKIDGEATKAELEAFYDHFPVPEGNSDKAAELFYDAYMDHADSRHYAAKIVSFYPDNAPLYGQMLMNLIRLAFADKPMNAKEYGFIRKIAAIFGFSDEAVKGLIRDYLIPQSSDPYVLLGTKRRAAPMEVKKAYRDAIKDCHPDSFARQDVAPEVKAILIDKFKRLTNAYEAISKFRKFE